MRVVTETIFEWAPFICHANNTCSPFVHESECQSLGVVYTQGFLPYLDWPSLSSPEAEMFRGFYLEMEATKDLNKDTYFIQMALELAERPRCRCPESDGRRHHRQDGRIIGSATTKKIRGRHAEVNAFRSAT